MRQTVTKISDNLPFSNLWIAIRSINKLPAGCVLHLGILNSLRSWNMFDIPDTVYAYSNTGGFGIDGDVSSMIGASLVHKEKLYFCIVGDLAFFYDMNVLGNRHVGNNVRIMIINNGKGTEFRNYNHPGADFGEEADDYIAAAGHYGNKSGQLVKHYAQDLGYEYLCASTKEEFLSVYERFLTPGMTEKPMVFEVFTDSQEESEALKICRNTVVSAKGLLISAVAKTIGKGRMQILKQKY